MELDLASGVSSCVDRNRLRRSWPWTLFAAAVLVLQLGSRADRVVVAGVWLALVFLPVERYIRQLAALTKRTALPHYLLLGTIALVWAWANARLRLGEGPFHIVDADLWRGYPFMFEEWYWSQNGSGITWHRQFHWIGLLGNVLILTTALLAVLQRLPRRG